MIKILSFSELMKELDKPPVMCLMCQTENWQDAKQCVNCGKPLESDIKH